MVENVQRRDEKYWLPGQPEEAYVCIRVSKQEHCWKDETIEDDIIS